ncbi:nucleolar complex protein 2 homolog [Argiope bruennichi]|uniref:nucleolar complex protein 2 homolog n=1 Tax=Argiope bruennichi TaxID=94029 RepID=UPI002493F755|nr:nucleolar complex protein 2 homolog [Argiope bruennichi]
MSSDSEVEEASTHAATLKKLKFKDPDFYEFLKENDKELLEFKDSESEDDEQEAANDDEEEVEDEPDIKISAQKLAFIKENIGEAPTFKLCKALIQAFKSAVNQADGSDKKIDMSNSEFFNDVIKLCLIELVPALYKVMHISAAPGKKKIDPTKSKVWKKAQMSVKSYLIDMLKMISLMKESSVLVLLLKHTVHLIPFYNVFIKLSRHLLKKMVTLWSSEEETVRVLSLMIIVRSTKSLPKEYLGQVLKEMYFAYIKNTKFTSPTTWPMINFMKRSLTEVYALNPEMAYEHGFIYIRQMSIHLRNAITTKKKEAFQTVYNWQYTHCILLWSHLLCRLVDHEPLKSLIYPLVQTTIGAINLIPTAKYIPLRFHLVKALMHISKTTGIFIPVLPFILDVLKIVDFNKKSNFSVKPVEFSCALKVTKSQLLEAGFKDSCISEVCCLLIDYLKIYASSIGFPELALPAVLQIKNFIKQCKVSKYNQQLKTVLVKIEENSLLISEKRRLVTFSIADNDQVKRWEENICSEGTPLLQMKTESKKESVVVVEDMPPKKKRKHKK